MASTPSALADASRSLPARYEIRRLEPKHSDWANAIVIHSNCFHSPVWPTVYQEGWPQRAYAMFKGFRYAADHQIASGMTYGVFDREYNFKRPESAATGGAVYWDLESEAPATPKELLDAMDNPLVSVALAYDAHDPLDPAQLQGVFTALPLFQTLFSSFHTLDPRPKETYTPTGPGQILFRAATSSRADAEGKGIMKALAHHLINQARKQGYRVIQIETAHDAVTHVWANPPLPCRSTQILEIDLATFEGEDADGKRRVLFAPATQICRKFFVEL